jgi:sugar lactone lactonase YvrE
MVRMRRIALGVISASLFLALTGCPSPFLTAIKQAVANAPFTATSYNFVRQWGNPDPAHTFASPIVKADTAGNVYVADSSFRIRKYDAAGNLLNTIGGVSGKGTSAQLYDLAFDAFGNMYAVTNNTNQIQKYNSSGGFVLDWGGTTTYGVATPVAALSPKGIAVDSNGNVFVVDTGHNRIVVFDSGGNFTADWGGSTVYGSSAFIGPTGVAVDSSNSVYVLDKGNHRVVKFLSSHAYSIDWGGGASTYGTNTTVAAMSSPSGISVSSSQYVFVVDTGNTRFLKFSSIGTYQIGYDYGASGTANGQFTNPNSIAVDSAGSVYVTDSPASAFEGRVQKFNGSVTPPTWLASWGGALGAGAGVTLAPWGAAFDPSGNIEVVELLNTRVHKFDPNGNSIALWGGFTFPTSVAIDSAGKSYVTDFSGNRYQVLDTNGVSVKTVTNGPMSSPVGIALDSSGNVYVADAGHSQVLVFDVNGFVLRKWGSAGVGDGQFSSGGDYGIAVDPAGFVYVSDWLAHRIQKFDLMGNFLTKWGSPGSGNGQFNTPVGVAVDKIGNVYICDMLNHRVQKFDSSGKYLLSFGGVGGGNGTFAWPVGIAVSSTGNLVVTDYVGSLVQEFSPAP